MALGNVNAYAQFNAQKNKKGLEVKMGFVYETADGKVGKTGFGKGIWVGLEMADGHEGKNNGTVNGESYFKISTKRKMLGYLFPLTKSNKRRILIHWRVDGQLFFVGKKRRLQKYVKLWTALPFFLFVNRKQATRSIKSNIFIGSMIDSFFFGWTEWCESKFPFVFQKRYVYGDILRARKQKIYKEPICKKISNIKINNLKILVFLNNKTKFFLKESQSKKIYLIKINDIVLDAKE
ncbi:hypothetical protein RFI_20645 [Reticulomyxa filosa]|uniref:CAP-Gly domain-containing protein n=1 Tax=Reticulomyxa filosa TaxID=46433 RepID=X6MS71_RETFI|nr:hypothetical protein RFI_20645 [Reticulomyxa filosa]|eukprot:ETO16694.1 hypothetical protein RFI_20645 [Reticulomyxa filosa]